MKILIDGHNLGLKEPTGIGVYGNNLVECLNSLNHDVSILYGVGHIKKPWESIYKETYSFYKKLINVGEEPYNNYLKWAFYFLLYLDNVFLNKGIVPREVEFYKNKILKDILGNKIPKNTKVYNSANIFRISQAFSAITGSSLSLRCPNNLKDLEIFHATCPLPIRKDGKFKKIVTLHDLIPIKIPGTIGVNLNFYKRILKSSLKDADLIFQFPIKQKRMQSNY